MASFRTLTAEDLRDLLPLFGVAAGDYRGHTPIAAGTINTSVAVELSGRKVFLRVNEGKAVEDVEIEAAIVGHAASHGVATPAPFQAQTGQAFALWRGLLLSLFPWVPGQTLTRAEVTPSHAAQAGAALAGLHLAGSDFGDHRPGRYEVAEIESRLTALRQVSDERVQSAVAVLGPELAHLAGVRAKSVPLGLIHGDLFIDNVLFEESGRLSALLDFEQASWGRWVYDVAVTALAFAYGADDFRDDVLAALLAGYESVRPPTDEERAAFGHELAFASCRFAVTRITDVHLKRGAGAPGGKRFERYVQRLASVNARLRDAPRSLGWYA